MQILLIGCGDIRNLLCSLSSRPPAHVNSMQVHLNDINAMVLARSALLLHICAGIDPSCAEDIGFLWDVWYNTVWSKETFSRFSSSVTLLLENLESRQVTNWSH